MWHIWKSYKKVSQAVIIHYQSAPRIDESDRQPVCQASLENVAQTWCREWNSEVWGIWVMFWPNTGDASVHRSELNPFSPKFCMDEGVKVRQAKVMKRRFCSLAAQLKELRTNVPTGPAKQTVARSRIAIPNSVKLSSKPKGANRRQRQIWPSLGQPIPCQCRFSV